MIRIAVLFIKNVKAGIIRENAFPMNKPLLVKSLFALSNLSSSNFLLENARTTRRPVKCSLLTKLILSNNSWNFLNLGTIRVKLIISKINTRITAKTITHLIGLSITFVIAPIPIIGANNASLNTIVTTFPI